MTPELVSTVVLVTVVLVATVWELRTGNIPNVLTLPMIVVGLGLGVWGGTFVDHLLGFAVAAVPAYVAFSRHIAGGGLVKLGAAVGALSTWRFAGCVALLVAAAFLAFMGVAKARGREHGTFPGAPTVLGAVALTLVASWLVPALRTW